LDSVAEDEQIAFTVNLLQDCISLEAKMQKFYTDLEALNGGILYCHTYSKKGKFSQITGDDEMFPISYEFPQYHMGTLLMLYWASMTMLWSAITRLYLHLGRLAPLTPTPDNQLICRVPDYFTDNPNALFELPSPSRFADFASQARKVCQCVDYCLQDTLGMPAMAAPLVMIIDVLSDWPGFEKEIAWAINKLVVLQHQGMKMAKYVREQL
jgi:hypothetical protein